MNIPDEAWDCIGIQLIEEISVYRAAVVEVHTTDLTGHADEHTR